MKSANHAMGEAGHGQRRGYGIYAISVLAAGAIALWHLVQLIGIATASSWVYVSVGIAAGAAGADLITGLVHWACDTWWDERMRGVGTRLIRDFREHHRDPRAMVDHDWDVVNGQAAAPASLAFVLLALPPSQAFLQEHELSYACLYGLVTFSALANQVHQWAHMMRPPLAVRLLQRSGVILSPARHAVHHSGPHTRAYCISTGWLNPLLDATEFWRGLERAVTRVTGAQPRRDGAPTC